MVTSADQAAKELKFIPPSNSIICSYLALPSYDKLSQSLLYFEKKLQFFKKHF